MFNGTDELEEFVCPSGTALELKFGKITILWSVSHDIMWYIVHCQEDFFNDDLAFKPVYTHQVFGEK